MADWLNHRVQVFSSSFKHITTFTGDATISKSGWQKLRVSPEMVRAYAQVRDMTRLQRFRYPTVVAVDEQGTILVVDSSFHRIQVYRKQWEPITVPV